MQEDEATSAADAFTLLQSIQASGNHCRIDSSGTQLCPSMDLMVVSEIPQHQQHQENNNTNVSWRLIRTLNGQALAAWTDKGASSSSSSHAVACWSPNGKELALASSAGLHLYQVEDLVVPSGQGEAQPRKYSLEKSISSTSNQVLGMAWTRASICDNARHDVIARDSLRYSQQFASDSRLFLPPTDYQIGSNYSSSFETSQDEEKTSTRLTTDHDQFDLLGIATPTSLEVLVHGRFPWLSIARPPPKYSSAPPSPVALVASSNGSTWAWYAQDSGRVTLVTLPLHSGPLSPNSVSPTVVHTTARLAIRVQGHVATLQSALVELAQEYKTLLKPLVDKLSGPLARVCKNYEIKDAPVNVLRQFVALGSTSGSVANALDQFFTSVHFHDQIMSKLQVTLEGKLHAWERRVRTLLVAPSRALLLDVQEWASVLQAHVPVSKEDNASHWYHPAQMDKLVQASQAICYQMECFVPLVVQGRIRITELCQWLRSTSAQVKAKGTAADAPQRQTARKRQVAQAVVERMLDQLRQTSLEKAQGQKEWPYLNLVEEFCHIHIYTSMVPKEEEDVLSLHRPASPRSISGMEWLSSSDDQPSFPLLQSVSSTQEALDALAAHPRKVLSSKVLCHDVVLPASTTRGTLSVVRMHVRKGGRPPKQPSWLHSDSDDDEEEDEEENLAASARGYFSPNIVVEGGKPFMDGYFPSDWLIFAQGNQGKIQLFALPITGNADESCALPPFYLTSCIDFGVASSEAAEVIDISFYGDNGQSSLSSSTPTPTKEGRQALAVLVEQPKTSLRRVWLISNYDTELPWQAMPFESILCPMDNLSPDCRAIIVPVLREAEEPEDTVVVPARVRTFSSDGFGSQLNMSGSRGVGTIASADGLRIEVYDMEEDPDELDDSEEEDTMEEA